MPKAWGKYVAYSNNNLLLQAQDGSMRIVDVEGKPRGEVIDAYEGGGGVLLNVRHGGAEFEVPFAADICTSIDVGAKRIVVNLPEGLDEI